MSYASLSGIARTGLGVLLAGVLVLLGPTSQALGVRSEDEPARPQAAAGQESQTEQQAAGDDAQAADSQAQADAAPLKKDTTIRISKPDGTVVVKSGGSTWLRPGAKAPKAIRVTGSSSTGPQSVGAAAGPNRLHAPRPAHRRAVGAAEVASGAAARISSPTRGTVKVPANPVLLTAGRGGAGRSTGGGVVAGDEADTWLTGRGWVPGDDSGDDGAYISDLMADGFPVLEPGAGWDGPTDEPPPVGDESMPGWDAKAIARWDVVPYQTITDDFTIGVVAFHINGIDRVDFSVDGGPWVSVREMQLNPRTNVWEYTAVLRPSLFAEDGLVEVRAIAWPEGAGEPRVLGGDINAGASTGEHSMFLNANANGSTKALARYISPDGDDANDGLSADHPKLTVTDAIWSIQQEQGTADGGTVYLLPGEYAIASASWPRTQMTNSQRWLTITTAPGEPTESVHVRGAAPDNRLGSIRLLRWRNLSIDAVTGAEVVGSYMTGARVWYDAVHVDGVDRNSPNSNGIFGYTSWSGGKYATDSVVRNVLNATNGFALVRGVAIEKILADAFSGSRLVINSTVTDINQGDSEAHPDILQYYSSQPRNVVIYGLSSDPTFKYPNGVQGLFVGGVPTFEDVAIVNSNFINAPSWSSAFAIDGAVDNLYMSNTTIGGPARWGNNILTHNVVFDTTTWLSGPPPARDGVTYRPTDPH